MRATLASLLLLSLSCAPFAHRATASIDEYTHYRRFRTAEVIEAKLQAGYEYLERYPAGHWKGEVRRWFDRAEAGYLEAAWDDPRALRAFVDAAPRSPRAKTAAERAVALDLSRRAAARSEAALDERASRLAERLEAAESGRRELVTALSAWARRFARFRDFGARTHEMDHELIHAFRIAPPEARCAGDVCTKTVVVDYAVPEAKAQSDRQAVYDVRLELSEGGVRRWSLSGPDLWTRVGEAVYVRPIPPDDYGARAEALAKVAEIVAVASEPSLPSSRCALDPVSPVLLHRRCDGVELRVIAAIEPGADDALVLGPAPAGDGD